MNLTTCTGPEQGRSSGVPRGGYTTRLHRPDHRTTTAESLMNQRKSRHDLVEKLAAVAARYQSTAVIPHCAVCAQPCCRLDPLVLELDWKQLKALWQLAESRTVFDKRLTAGQGPEEIRAGNGLYYAHRKVCPAYDAARHACRVYDRDIKPVGCSDFPVYPDRSNLIADLRCEAVDLAALVTRIARTVGQEFRIVQAPDEDFPFLVTLSVRRADRATTSGKRPR